jgi:hypothetical protein
MYATSSKGGMLYETGAFADSTRALQDWAKSNAAIELNPGALGDGRVQEKPAGQLPNGFEQMIPVLIDLVRQAGGVNPELLGMSTASQQDPSGLLEMQRQRAGLTLLSQYFDAMALFRRRHGRLHLGMIKAFMNDERLVRVIGEKGAKFAPLLLEGDADDYDIITEGVPTSPNNRERNWRASQPLLPVFAQLGLPMDLWAEFLKTSSTLPEQFVDKMAARAAEMNQPNPEQAAQQKQQMELQVRAIVAEIMKDEASAQKDMASAKKAEAGALLDIAKAEESGGRLQLDLMKSLADRELKAQPDPNKMMELDSREREGQAQRAAQIFEGERSREAAKAGQGRTSQT